jgi:hypothetical protein
MTRNAASLMMQTRQTDRITLPMIEETARKLDAPLGPVDLALLQRVLMDVCAARGQAHASPEAEQSAKVIINLFQSGIRNRHQLVAIMTGRKFP